MARVPTEILERIICFYFQRDELLHLPEDNFILVTPSRGSTSLLLVSKGFRQLVLPSLYHSVSITEQSHYESLFKIGSGILDGEGEEAKLRRSWIRELRIDLAVEIGMAVEPDGELSPDPYQQGEDEDSDPNFSSPPCILITESYPTLFPNLDRITLLVSSLVPRPPKPSGTLPWPPHLIDKLKQRHLDLSNGPGTGEVGYGPTGQFLPSNPSQIPNFLQNVVFESLSSHSWMQKSDFLTWLEPRNVWFSLMTGRAGLGELPNLPFWRSGSTLKHLVHPPPPSSLDPSQPSLPVNLPHVAYGLGFSERSLVAQGLRFVDIPRGARPAFMKRYVEDATRRYAGMEAFEDEEDEDEGDLEEEEYERERPVTYGSFLELAKSQWKWVEEDGTEVDFEEGMRFDEEGKEERKE